MKITYRTLLRSAALIAALAFFLSHPGSVPARAENGASDPVINEFVVDHTGTDTHEFIEIYGDPNTDYSNYWILEIEGDSGSSTGQIDDNMIQVGVTDANGFWSTGFDPGGANDFENGNITLLLVSGFTGSTGDDIDTNDDGVIDATFWTAIVDDVAVDDNNGGQVYSTANLTPFYDGLAFAPGGASRIPDGTDTDTTNDWVRNDFDGAGLPGFTGTPDEGEALNTPGESNVAVGQEMALVINEIDYDQPGTDSAEFVEIYNAGGNAVSLDGLTLEFVNGNGAPVSSQQLRPCVQSGSGHEREYSRRGVSPH